LNENRSETDKNQKLRFVAFIAVLHHSRHQVFHDKLN